jgi:hypothetical protein
MLLIISLAYTDDGHIQVKISVALHVLTDLHRVLHQDAGLDPYVSKTFFLLPQGVSHQIVFDIAQNIIKNTPARAPVYSGNISMSSFCPELKVSLASLSKASVPLH